MATEKIETAELTPEGVARVVSVDRLPDINAVAKVCGRRVVDVSGEIFSVIGSHITWVIRRGFAAIEIVDDTNKSKL